MDPRDETVELPLANAMGKVVTVRKGDILRTYPSGLWSYRVYLFGGEVLELDVMRMACESFYASMSPVGVEELC